MKRREFLRALVRLVPAAVCGGVAVDAVRHPGRCESFEELVSRTKGGYTVPHQEIVDAFENLEWQPPLPPGTGIHYWITQGGRT